MKLLDWWDMSEVFFEECFKGNDTPEIRELITHPYWAYHYCKLIKDIEEMWSKIKESYWASMYCSDVKDRPEVRKYII